MDPIQTLSEDHAHSSWIVPGSVSLELGDAPIAAVEAGGEIAADLLEDRGHQVRVGVRLHDARFAVWIARADLLGVITTETAMGPDAMDVRLYAGAHVRIGKTEHGRALVTYDGAVRCSGEVASMAVHDVGPRAGPHGLAGRTLMVTPGTIIRAEPKWTARELAVVQWAYFLTEVQRGDDGWIEVQFDDDDVFVHGFVRPTDPPGRFHRQPGRSLPQAWPSTVLKGTCLYAREGGEPIGFVVHDQGGAIQPGIGAGWFQVAIDTPWGPITFAARGASETELDTCGSVTAP